jgi:hypothetical protein
LNCPWHFETNYGGSNRYASLYDMCKRLDFLPTTCKLLIFSMTVRRVWVHEYYYLKQKQEYIINNKKMSKYCQEMIENYQRNVIFL